MWSSLYNNLLLAGYCPSVTQSYSHVYTCTASPSQALTSPSTLSQFLVFFCLFPSLVFLCLSLPASHLLVQSLVSHLFSVSVIILLSCPEFAPVSHLLMVSLSFDCSCVPGLYFVFCYLPLFLGSIWGFYGCVLQLYCIKASLPVNHLSARVSCIWAHLPCMTVTLSGCTHSPWTCTIIYFSNGFPTFPTKHFKTRALSSDGLTCEWQLGMEKFTFTRVNEKSCLTGLLWFPVVF